MVVEDDPDIRECVRLILEGQGFSVVTAGNGAEAEVALARMDEPCVVLLDLMMPVMNGWEFLERLERAGRLDGIRVVAVSAAPVQLPTGLVEFMPKPVGVEQLIATVRQYC
jgi:CheY-like chemotaxis protein